MISRCTKLGHVCKIIQVRLSILKINVLRFKSSKGGGYESIAVVVLRLKIRARDATCIGHVIVGQVRAQHRAGPTLKVYKSSGEKI